MRQIRQMSVEDWAAEFLSNPAARNQLDYIRRRQRAGLPLATWESNALIAANIRK